LPSRTRGPSWLAVSAGPMHGPRPRPPWRDPRGGPPWRAPVEGWPKARDRRLGGPRPASLFRAACESAPQSRSSAASGCVLISFINTRRRLRNSRRPESRPAGGEPKYPPAAQEPPLPAGALADGPTGPAGIRAAPPAQDSVRRRRCTQVIAGRTTQAPTPVEEEWVRGRSTASRRHLQASAA
jgi:hypothetical protein